ncbi:MAG TPA: hypothetical protein DDW50_00590, partial [Firmicutes bacterium]|nr:hypothetical protein [Bacillota bacterium]
VQKIVSVYPEPISAVPAVSNFISGNHYFISAFADFIPKTFLSFREILIKFFSFESISFELKNAIS